MFKNKFHIVSRTQQGTQLAGRGNLVLRYLVPHSIHIFQNKYLNITINENNNKTT